MACSKDCNFSVEHAIWLFENKPRSAIKIIKNNIEYLELKTRLEMLQCKTLFEALYLYSQNLMAAPLCECGNPRVFWVSGKSKYPRLLCGTCAKSKSVKRMMELKNTKNADGLNGHQLTAFKARDTKRKTFDSFGKNTYQLISEKSSDKKAIAMAKYFASINENTGDLSQTFLYVIFDKNKKLFKIGRSKNPVKRIKGMQLSANSVFELIFLARGEFRTIAKTEMLLHEYFEEDNKLQSKKYPGRTEWFNSTIEDELKIILEDLQNIVKICFLKE